jgi:hypothetical protein
MIQEVSKIFLITSKIVPAFGIIKFHPLHGELHLGTYLVTALHNVPCCNSPCTKCNLKNQFFPSVGHIKFHPVNGELPLGTYLITTNAAQPMV